MSIVWFLLKMLGILLLVVLGIVLLAAVSFLFVPVRYQVRGKVSFGVNSPKQTEETAAEEDADRENKNVVGVGVHWLLHLISARIVWQNTELSYKLRICGISVGKKKKKAASANTEKKTTHKRPPNERMQTAETQAVDDVVEMTNKPSNERMQTAERQAVDDVVEMTNKPPNERMQTAERQAVDDVVEMTNKPPNERMQAAETQSGDDVVKINKKQSGEWDRRSGETGEKKSDFVQRIRAFFRWIKALPGMIRYKMEKLKEKISNGRKLAARMWQELLDEQNRGAVKIIWREVLLLLKHASPKRIRTDVRFGMEDPARTGQIIGAVSILPMVYRYDIHICPDFSVEHGYVKGNFDLKGGIRGFRLMVLIVHLWKDKNIQHLLQKYRIL